MVFAFGEKLNGLESLWKVFLDGKIHRNPEQQQQKQVF